MDFMKILKSLEEFLFEVMMWLVFFPLTLWQVLVRPSAMMAYADDELDDNEQDQYTDRLSPPVFLALALALTHGLELVAGLPKETSRLLADDSNLLAYRLIIFSVFPLITTVRLMRMRKQALDRKILKAPFYSQCYVAAPFAAAVSSAPLAALALPLSELDKVLALIALLLVATTWYLVLQARWFARELGTSLLGGAGHAVAAFLEALLVTGLLSAIVTRL
jgi:hypothetical protein